MRRIFQSGLGALALAVALSACGGSGDSAEFATSDDIQFAIQDESQKRAAADPDETEYRYVICETRSDEGDRLVWGCDAYSRSDGSLDVILVEGRPDGTWRVLNE